MIELILGALFGAALTAAVITMRANAKLKPEYAPGDKVWAIMTDNDQAYPREIVDVADGTYIVKRPDGTAWMYTFSEAKKSLRPRTEDA